MTFSTPWLGRKRVAFVPLFRTNAAPPDQIPPDWENVILRRVVNDPRPEANGADRSLRAWLRAASSGLADIDPLVLPMQTIDKQVVEANELEGTLGSRLRDQGMDAAVLVMLGKEGAATNAGFWSRVVMEESNGKWLMELIHGLTGFKDLYHFDNDVDPRERAIDSFDEMSASSQTHPTAFTKNELGWLDAAAIPLHAGASVDYELQYISLAQPPAVGRAAAVRIGNGFPYMMVEARKMTDQFEAGMPSTGDFFERGIASEGVIAYRIQTRNPTVQEREVNKKPLYLLTLTALQPGQSAVLDNSVALTITGARPDGFAIRIEPAWNGPADLTTVNNIVSVAGHFSTGDQRHLVVVGAAHGKVHEIFWKPAQQGIEGENDLPVDFGAGTIVSVAALHNSDQQRHVVLVGKTDGKVHEIFWKADTVGIEGHDDLPVTFSPGAIVAVSGLYNNSDQRHVVVVGTTAGEVHEIFWKVDTVGIEGHNVVPVTFAPGSIVALTAFYNNSDQRHVVVVGTSAGKLHEIFWKSDTVGIEGHSDFPVSFDSGSIVAVSGFYDSNTERHVVAVGTRDGKVHQVYWKADTVGIEAHSMVTQFSANSIVSLAGFYSASDQIEHIVVGLATGRLCELWVKPAI